jgi:hypothetical protein
MKAATALQLELLQVHETSCELPLLPTLLLLLLLLCGYSCCVASSACVWQQR